MTFSGIVKSGTLLAVVHLFGLTACTPTTPRWDAVFGETVRTAIAQQTLNPEAARDTDPVAGIDGKSGKSALEQYEKSFTKPEPQPNTFTIGVGRGSR